jgi:HEAT repeat protein
MERSSNNINEAEFKKLLEALLSEKGTERKKARKALVANGKKSLPYLKEFIHHPKHFYRWEAMKTMEEIADPESIPIFIEALEDDESDIRWIAAQGLIKIGKLSLQPLLKAIVEKPDSIFVLSSAHHVLHDLKINEHLPSGFPVDKLLSVLKGSATKAEIELTAYEIMKQFG